MLECGKFVYTLEIVARILSDGVNRDRLCGTNTLLFLVCLYACLFVCFIDKTRAVKPLGRSHLRILSFTQDGPAVSTITAQRVKAEVPEDGRVLEVRRFMKPTSDRLETWLILS